jgi:DnaJ-class molecular chaperone
MRIRLSHLRRIIRETVEQVVQADKDADLNKDGENDFEDVMIARMKASGMDSDDAIEKGEMAAKKAKQTEAAAKRGKKTCPACFGTGVNHNTLRDCDDCDGTGKC